MLSAEGEGDRGESVEDISRCRVEREVCMLDRRADWEAVGSRADVVSGLREVVDVLAELTSGEVCVAMSRWKSSVGSELMVSTSSSSSSSPVLCLRSMLELLYGTWETED